MSRILAAVATLGVLAQVDGAAVVQGVTAPGGSLAGGTKVIISGSGFYRNGRDGQTNVFFGNDLCPIEWYNSRDDQLQCWAPAHAVQESVPVRVQVIDINAKAQYAACPKNNCNFAYKWDRTPILQSMALGGAAGTRVQSLISNHGAPDHQDFDIRIAGAKCDVDPEDNPSLRTGPWASYVNCTQGWEPEAGRYNVSYAYLDAVEGYGNAMPSRSMIQVDPYTGQQFHYTVFPTITGITAGRSGLVGGQEVTITGYGFSWTAGNNQVMLAGVPCRVTSASNTAIKCIVGSSAASTQTAPVNGTWVPGQAGLRTNVFNNVQQLDNAELTGPAVTAVNGHGLQGMVNSYGIWYYTQDNDGFFVPPITANYTFYTRGDDSVAVYLSTTQSKANAVRVAFTPGYLDSFWATGGQISAPIPLIGGQSYWFRARHTQITSDNWFDIAIRITPPNPGATLLEAGTGRELKGFSSDAQRVWETTPTVQRINMRSGVQREVQTITIAAAGGQWTIGQMAMTAAGNVNALEIGATASQVQAALNGYKGCGSVSVSRTAVNVTASGTIFTTAAASAASGQTVYPGYSWSVTFRCPVYTPFEMMTPQSLSLTPVLGQGTPFMGVVRTVTPSTAIGGSWRINLPSSNANTTTVSFGASATTLAGVLNALTGVSVTVSGSTGVEGGSLLVTFFQPAGRIPLLVPVYTDSDSGAVLTGTNVTMSVNEVHAGSLDPFLWPAPADYFRTALPLPPIEVVSNGVRAQCDANAWGFRNPNATIGQGRVGQSLPLVRNSDPCTFIYDDAITPTITALSTTTITAGTQITITGTNFMTPALANSLRPAPLGSGLLPLQLSDLNIVRLNDSICNVTAVTATSITCTVADSAFGSYDLSVEVGLGGGLARPSTSVTVTYGMSVTGVSPLVGSHAGGTIVTLIGTGFRPYASGNTVSVGGRPCSVETAFFTRVTCRTPSSAAGSGTSSVAIVANGQTYGSQFAYNDASTPSLAGIAPAALSTAISGSINVTVANVPAGSKNAASLTVTVGGRSCRITAVSPIPSTTNTLVTCTLLRGPAPPLPHTPVTPVVDVAPVGYASSGGVSLNTAFSVSSLSTQVGSLEGGTVVTITGTGFSPLLWPNEVWFKHTDNFTNEWWETATVISASADGTQLVAQIPFVPDWHRAIPQRRTINDPVTGVLVIKTNNLTAPCDASLNNCAFEQNFASTPVLGNHSTIEDVAAPSGKTLQVTGPNVGVAGLVISIGAYTCGPVTVVDATTVRCPLPVGTAGINMIMLSSPLGKGRHDPTCLNGGNYVFPFRLGSISASTGSYAGGLPVTITGAGFAADDLTRNVVKFSTATAMVVSANETTMVVLAPPVATTITGPQTVSVTLNTKDATGAVVYNDGGSLASAFTYSLTVSPTLTSIAPTTGAAGTALVIRGTGFGNFSASNGVFIGGAPCAITTSNDTTILCTVGQTPAGAHRVIVSIAGRGYARQPATPPTFTISLVVSSVSPARSSFAGGAIVRLSGSGFPSSGANGDQLVVNIGATPARIISASYTGVTVETPVLLTRQALADANLLPVLQPAMIMGTASPVQAHDMDVSTTTPVGTCVLSQDMGPSFLAVVTMVSFYPAFKQADAMKWGIFEGSMDNTNWNTIVPLTSDVHENWNEVDVAQGAPYASLPTYRYLRFRFRSGVSCSLAEIMYTGFTVSVTDPMTAGIPVSIAITPAANRFVGTPAAVNVNLPSAQTILYASGSTPVITDITPNNGTALGGTLVTITGSNLPSIVAETSVSFNGITCDVQTASATAVTCITRKRTSIMTPEVKLTASGASGGASGVAVYNARTTYFRYLDRWSSLTTWKYQEPPVDGDTVVIPAGQSVLLDMPTPKLVLLLVQGDLIVDRQDGLSIDATYMLVQGGRFEVGTAAQPHMNTFTLTLWGDRYQTIELPEIGAKVLGIMDSQLVDPDMGMDMGQITAMINQAEKMDGFRKGILDLHGKPRKRVWTLLANTAPAGSNTITLAEDVDWAVGEQVFVTAPGVVGGDGIEVRTIVEVVGPRSVILDAPFGYDHVSEIFPAQQYGHSDVDMRAEVGLMSRNVIVQGNPGSNRQYFGSHMAAFHGGILRVENIEIRNCGQAGNLGRYCSHTHMRGNVQDSYIRYNSIHDSNQRAVTVHATINFVVKGNAVYNVMGHTIFVEDGVEQFNVIEENLVARTLPCNFCTASDNKPANFWTASPTNHWRSNRAAGSTHWGFWFELPGSPFGPSFSPSRCPDTAQLGSFFNNSAHSNSIGLRIYPHFAPLNVECDYSQGSKPQWFQNTTVFKNAQGMFHRKVGDVHHLNTKWVANSDGFFWRQMPLQDITPSWIPNIQSGLFVCNTNNPAACGSRAITMPQNEFWMMQDVAFVNYGQSGAIAGCAVCDNDVHFNQGGHTYRMKGLRWFNSDVRTYWNSPYKCIYWDLDGTLTGFINGSATPYYGFNNWPECPRDTTGALGYASVCNGQVMPRRVQIDNFAPPELQFVTMNISSAAGWGSIKFRPMEIFGWVAPMVNYKTGYSLSWQGTLIDWRRLRVRYSEPEYIDGIKFTRAAARMTSPESESEHLGLKLSWIDTRYRNQVLYGDAQTERPNLPYPALPGPSNDFGTGSMPDRTNKTWEVIMTNKNTTASSRWGQYMFQVYNIQCAPWECGAPAPAALGNVTDWSDYRTWNGLFDSRPGRIPGAGDDVVINATMNVNMDVNPPKLGKLTIIGRLQFKDNGPRSLNCESIVNWGQFVVGTADAPFTNTAEVVLHGNRYSPTVLVDNNLFLSNKVFANLGSVSMVGVRRNIVWTRLASTANIGDNVITMQRSVQGAWFPGDTIVLTATEFDHTQYEQATIAAVNGAQVTLTAPLRFRHYSGPAATSGVGASTFLRAAAGVLTRNIVFRGNLTDDSLTYGASMVTARVSRTIGGKTTSWLGSVDLRYVEFRNTGKQLTEHAAILFQYGNYLFDTTTPATNPYNYLEGVAFNNGFNYGIKAMSAKHIAINNTVFFNNVRNTLHIDDASTNFTLVDSLFVANLRSPDVNTPDQQPWYRHQGAVVIYSVPGRMSGNVVSGAIDTGFTYRVPDCTADHARLYSGNEAQASRVGVWLLSSYSTSGCVRMDGFTVWKSAHLGVTTLDQVSNMIITNSVISDNHIGMSLSYDKGGMAETTSTVTDTRIFGTTLASVGCTQSTVCKAVVKEDVTGDGCNSVLGSEFRRAGWLIPQNMNHGKTCERDEDQQMPVCEPPNIIVRLCGLPLEKRYGTRHSINNAARFNRVTFGYFNQTDCGKKSFAIAHNPTQVDQSVPHYMRGITWENTPVEARMHFRINEQTDESCQDGVGCDGINMIYMQDLDGSFTGQAGTVVLGPNPALTYESPHCTNRPTWNGFECSGKYYPPTTQTVAAGSGVAAITTVGGSRPVLRYAHFTPANDAGHSRIAYGGVQFTRQLDVNDNTTWSTSMSFGEPKKDSCAMRPVQNMRPFIVGVNTTMYVQLAALEPDFARFRFFSNDPSEAVIVKMFISRPFGREMRLNGQVIPMIDPPDNKLILPKITDPAGTWMYSPQERAIWFVMRGSPLGPQQLYELAALPSVQLNMHLAISVEEFFGPAIVDAFSVLLGIPRWRIKIVDVQAGSVSCNMMISAASPANSITTVADTTFSANATDNATLVDPALYTAQLTELRSIAQLIQAKVATNEIAKVIPGFQSLTVTVADPFASAATGGGQVDVTGGASGSSTGMSPGIIAAVAVGSIFGAVFILGGILMLTRMAGAGAQQAPLRSAPSQKLASHQYSDQQVRLNVQNPVGGTGTSMRLTPGTGTTNNRTIMHVSEATYSKALVRTPSLRRNFGPAHTSH